jgi:hypothetical protein
LTGVTSLLPQLVQTNVKASRKTIVFTSPP